jgi:anti-anti-sigma regulatory factor
VFQGSKHTVLEHERLRIVVDAHPPLLLISLAGELDFTCTALIRAVPATGWGPISSVTSDLSQLTFSDTSGMQALLDLKATHRALGRKVHIVNARPVLHRLCGVLGGESLLTT